jgi:ubiquinol-cytochrome c reductase cytochrome c subunit
VSTTNPQSDAVSADVDTATTGPVARARDRRRSTGALYSVFSPAQAAPAESGTESAAEAAGRELYERSCITCHGTNLEGVPNRGPSLIGVGEAAVYFQVHTGRMPLARQEADAADKPAVFSDEEIDQLMAYVQANGGGPRLPSGDLRDGDVAEGGELFRLYTAMLSGPENMPVFGDNQLTPEEKRSIIAYVQTLNSQSDPGGAGIGRMGPVAEGLVMWVVGIGVLMFGIFWMGSKA